MNMTHTTNEESILADFFANARAASQRAEQASQNLIEHLPALRAAIATGSGQGQRIHRIALSCWNGDNTVGLCDELCGLDHALAEGVLALLAAALGAMESYSRSRAWWSAKFFIEKGCRDRLKKAIRNVPPPNVTHHLPRKAGTPDADGKGAA